MKSKLWVVYTLTTTVFWGIWGAFIEIPEKAGFPATLGYVVWSLTMIPCAVIALSLNKWKLDVNARSVFLGSMIGFLGAGGQLILFEALRKGPAYIVFPLISLFPILTVFLSLIFLGERVSKKQAYGIALALVAIFLLSYQPGEKGDVTPYGWLILSVLVFVLWGVQAYVMKHANNVMHAESIFFYMMLTAVLLSPVAWMMTNFENPVNLAWNGPYLAAGIHLLNAIGALTLVYALRYGKAMIVTPVTGLSPLITVIISLLIYGIVPGPVLASGVVVSMLAIYLLSE